MLKKKSPKLRIPEANKSSSSASMTEPGLISKRPSELLQLQQSEVTGFDNITEQTLCSYHFPSTTGYAVYLHCIKIFHVFRKHSRSSIFKCCETRIAQESCTLPKPFIILSNLNSSAFSIFQDKYSSSLQFLFIQEFLRDNQNSCNIL